MSQAQLVASTSSGYLNGLKNRIINGDMRIDQRNSGSAVTPTASSYTVDRWQLNSSQASKLTLQQVADAPTGLKYSTKITVATAYSPTATDNFLFQQPIEGQNIIDFQLGLAGAATITLSSQIKGSIAGTYSIALRNAANNRNYIGTVSVTTSWAPIKLTVVGDITGTWVTDNTAGLYLSIDLGSGTNFAGTSGVWQAGNLFRTTGSVSFVSQVAGSTLNITGVQLELGSVATPFEQRPIGYEFAACQRYYQTSITSMRITAAAAGSYLQAGGNLQVTMRATPTATLVSEGVGNVSARTYIVANSFYRLEASAAAAGDAYVLNRTDALSAEL